VPGEASELEITGIAQRSAWLDRSMPPVEQLGPDLWSIPVPLPVSPLRYTSVYVLAGEGGLTLIDAGWDSADSWQALVDGLTKIGASPTDIDGVLVTHQHLDHIGLAQRVHEASGAWIAIHPADNNAIMSPQFRDPLVSGTAELAWLTSLGASNEEATRLIPGYERRAARASIAVPDRLIHDGERIEVPGWSLRAVHTPGHTPGHLCFVDDAQRVLFAGDHVLPRISPNISADRDPQVDALGNFLASLTKVAQFDVDEVLPAHEWRFRGLSTRVDQLQAHHELRLNELLELVRREPDATPWHLASGLTWSRTWAEYDGRIRVSAVGETAAHLVHLVRRGLITPSGSAVPTYRAVD
jgi:glyoxylase-like metal-dependent hydrolase (beta-lactamase superfamily II)